MPHPESHHCEKKAIILDSFLKFKLFFPSFSPPWHSALVCNNTLSVIYSNSSPPVPLMLLGVPLTAKKKILASFPLGRWIIFSFFLTLFKRDWHSPHAISLPNFPRFCAVINFQSTLSQIFLNPRQTTPPSILPSYEKEEGKKRSLQISPILPFAELCDPTFIRRRQ